MRRCKGAPSGKLASLQPLLLGVLYSASRSGLFYEAIVAAMRTLRNHDYTAHSANPKSSEFRRSTGTDALLGKRAEIGTGVADTTAISRQVVASEA